jgi:hypothetical protein
MFPIVLHPISFALNSNCNYTSSPKEEIPTYLFFWVYLKFDEFFGDRPIKDANYKGKKNSTWWSPQLMNMSYHKILPNSHTHKDE